MAIAAALDGRGSRVYASGGFPGAEWWAAGSATGSPERADVELAEVDALFTDSGLWADAFGPPT